MNRLMRVSNQRPVRQRPAASGVATLDRPTVSNAAAPVVPIELDPPPAMTTAITCDQAIFTSIRSPMGEGYRIVGHSAGVTHDEKAEITRRAPSHGSIASESPDAFGMLAFKLASGRFVVAHCVFAGKEHTGRGGDRVWSHFAIVDEAAYRKFGNNPIRMQRALATVIAPNSPVDRMEALSLPAWDQGDLAQHVTSAEGCEKSIRLLDACARGGRWALAGIGQPARSLEWALDLLPVLPRREISLSYGLAFCLGRGLQITAVDCVRAGVERMIRGQDVHLRDLAADAGETLPVMTPWYDLIRAWLPAQRWRRIAKFAARIEGALDPERLGRVARLSLDLDAAITANEEVKAEFREKYAGFESEGELENELFDQLQEAIAPPPEPDEEE